MAERNNSKGEQILASATLLTTTFSIPFIIGLAVHKAIHDSKKMNLAQKVLLHTMTGLLLTIPFGLASGALVLVGAIFLAPTALFMAPMVNKVEKGKPRSKSPAAWISFLSSYSVFLLCLAGAFVLPSYSYLKRLPTGGFNYALLDSDNKAQSVRGAIGSYFLRSLLTLTAPIAVVLALPLAVAAFSLFLAGQILAGLTWCVQKIAGKLAGLFRKCGSSQEEDNDIPKDISLHMAWLKLKGIDNITKDITRAISQKLVKATSTDHSSVLIYRWIREALGKKTGRKQNTSAAEFEYPIEPFAKALNTVTDYNNAGNVNAALNAVDKSATVALKEYIKGTVIPANNQDGKGESSSRRCCTSRPPKVRIA